MYSLEEVRASALASEFIDGSTLRAVIDNAPVDAATVHAAALQIAQGLRAAHEAGVVHRDLKPENILMTAGGSARSSTSASPGWTAREEAAHKLTRAGAMIGTPAYMAPEQLMGQQVDARTRHLCVRRHPRRGVVGRHPLSVSDAVPVARERPPGHEALARLLQRIADTAGRRRRPGA